MKTARRLLIPGILSLLFFCLSASFVQSPAGGLEEDVLSSTNKFRKSKGLKALEMNSDLNAIAEKHSSNMARGKVAFGHDGFNQRDAQARKAIKGMNSFAENVAYGASTGKEVVNMWKSSSGHRRNMLGSFKYIGIGTARDKRGVLYYTQVFAN